MPKSIYLVVCLFVAFTLTNCETFVPHEEQLVGAWKVSEAEKTRGFNRDDVTDTYKGTEILFQDGSQVEVQLNGYNYRGQWQLINANDGTIAYNDDCGEEVEHRLGFYLPDLPALKYWNEAGIEFVRDDKVELTQTEDNGTQYRFTLSRLTESHLEDQP